MILNMFESGTIDNVHNSKSKNIYGVYTLLTNVLSQLHAVLLRQRDRDRSANTDLLGSLIIEQDEAESLVKILQTDYCESKNTPESTQIISQQIYSGLVAEVIKRFDIDNMGEIALALVLGVEVDSRFARLVGFLNDHPSHVRPTLGLVWETSNVSLGEAYTILGSPIIQDGLLEIIGTGPLSTRELKIESEFMSRFFDIQSKPSKLCITKVNDAQKPVNLSKIVQLSIKLMD